MNAKHEYTNDELAELLRKISAVYLVLGENPFKVVAYEKAALEIESMPESIKYLWEENKLKGISGIGTNIRSYLDELFSRGEVKHFNELLAKVPEAMFEFMKIPGIGPKSAYKLSLKLGIRSKEHALDMLLSKAKKQNIRKIEGFGEKTEQEIIANLNQKPKPKKRLLLSAALNVAEELSDYLKKCPKTLKISVLGSLRRAKSSIGDIDIAVASEKPQEVIKWFTTYPKVSKVSEAGEDKASVITSGQNQIDLRVVDPKSWGAMLQYFTGSKNHNIKLREYALKKGLSLSEYGIKKFKIKNSKLKINDKIIKFSKEEEFYGYLGMKWIPPELREDSGEIEASISDKLPKLVELKDIKGDLHLHSNFDAQTSHDVGISSINNIVETAILLKYEYISISDHNPSTINNTESKIISIIKRKKDFIDKLNYSKEKKLFVFNSLEVDINPHGKRNLPDKALELLDFAIVSIHSNLNMDKDKMTKRILQGLDHPKVKILAHPTQRKINERPGYALNWDLIFDFCLKRNKLLEINSFPNRLDLPNTLIREAIKSGVKLVINTDSHDARDMENIKYGVYTARRGWANNSDIINTLSYNKLSEFILRRL